MGEPAVFIRSVQVHGRLANLTGVDGVVVVTCG